MHVIAAASSAEQYGAWAYLAVFALMALTFIGIPAIGAVVVGWASVLASQGKLNIAVVLIVAALGAEVGGLIGYAIGARWGRRLLDLRGPWQERRQQAVARAEAIYAKWGRLAVFFTPTLVSGLLRMKYSQFVVWNFLAGAAYVISVGLSVYGAGKVVTGQHDPVSVGSLVVGIAVGVTVFLLGRRYYRRRKARRAGALGGLGAAMSAPAAADEES